LENVGPFTDYVGPFFVRRTGLAAGEPLRLGFRIERHHCNPRLVCHGGMLATFVDLCLARGLREADGIAGSVPTINMTLDYLAPAPLDSWIESRISVMRRTAKMGFLEVILHCAGEPVVRGSGIYKRARPF